MDQAIISPAWDIATPHLGDSITYDELFHSPRMRVRDLEPKDEPILAAAYLSRGFAGGWRPLAGVVEAMVVVDEWDRPVVLVGAHMTAEVRAVVDPEFATPAVREYACLMAHDALMDRLKKRGITKVFCLLEGVIARGFSRRMQRLRGWVPSRGAALEREV